MAEPVIHFRQSVSGFLRLIRGQAREGQTTDANCDAGYNNPSPLSPSAQFRRRMRRIRGYPPEQEPPMLHLRQRCGLVMGESGSDAANPMEKSHSRRWRIFPRLCPLRQSRSAAAKPSDAYGEGVFSAGGSSSVLPRGFRRMGGARRCRTQRRRKTGRSARRQCGGRKPGKPHGRIRGIGIRRGCRGKSPRRRRKSVPAAWRGDQRAGRRKSNLDHHGGFPLR